MFGSRLPLAARYAELLAGAGVERGLIGPRETSRLWERHLLNCAVLGELLPTDSALLDVGSGAGLPGLPLSIARPDLHVTLVEPLERRCLFLQEVVDELGLSVTVIRARAEDVGRHVEPVAVVTARAVAPLRKLVPWCLPLVARDGVLLAMKGASAAEEVQRDDAAVRTAGGVVHRVLRCGVGVVSPPATVIEVGHRQDRGARRDGGST